MYVMCLCLFADMPVINQNPTIYFAPDEAEWVAEQAEQRDDESVSAVVRNAVQEQMEADE